MTKLPMPPAVAEAVIDRSGGGCEVQFVPVCTGRAEHLHHRKISGREHLVSNLLHVCGACHRWIHAHPAASYEHGWLVKMNHTAGDVIVTYRGEPVALPESGEVIPYSGTHVVRPFSDPWEGI